MAHFNFAIPRKTEELLTESDDYWVRNVVAQQELLNQFRDAKLSFRDEGAEFILNTFDVFYSVLYHGDTLKMDVIFNSYQDLHKAVIQLNNSIGFLLEDKSSINDEIKQKYQNIMKMLIYVYIQTVLLIEDKNFTRTKNQGLLKVGRKKNVDLTYNVDKNGILLTLNNIIQRNIALFWDPPVVEENFLNIIAEVCFKFLHNPSVKGEKNVRQEIFNLIGILIINYNLGTTFVLRMVDMIKSDEHLVVVVSEGVQQLVNLYNCKSLIHELVREITEWQTNETFQDSQGSKLCAQLLTAMAVLMPKLMIPELSYLNKYLDHESAALRNSILNVITEVLINVLSKHALNEEETEFRDDFLTILMDHMKDTSAHVRSKIMQHWSRLQQENAIPRKLVNEVLENVIEHLQDKSALVRKSAANCVTIFLESNAYGAELSLTKMTAELQHNESILNTNQHEFDPLIVKKHGELETEWNTKVPEIRKVLEEELKKEEEGNEDDDEEEENELPKSQVLEIIVSHLSDGKYKEAYRLCKESESECEEFEKYRDANKQSSVDIYLEVLKRIYINPPRILQVVRQEITQGGAVHLSHEDLNKFEILQEKVTYLQEAVTFLKLIESVMAPMVDLLESTTVGDMQEAVAFFISAYKFNIDGANQGVMAMLRIMQRNEQDRKDMIIEAFKTIYLLTDASNMQEHCTIIVNRLIAFLKVLPDNDWDHFELIISEWVGKGILDNNIIDMLWQYFTQKVSVSDQDSHVSVFLLKMAALKRKTIISRNIKLVATIGFGERGAKNLAFLGSVCELLAVAGKDRIDITSPEPPFKIAANDQLFQDLFNILSERFLEDIEYYHEALMGAIDVVYKLCGQPDKVCENFLKQIIEKLAKDQGDPKELLVDRFVYMRLCELLGLVALKHLNYLDETVYKELKRREYMRNKRQKERKKDNKKSKIDTRKKVVNDSVISNQSAMNSTLTRDNTAATADDSNFEGAQAEDDDAEFILRVLEHHTVSGSGALGKLAYIIKNVCEKPGTYDDAMLQGVAVTALLRYMLVSSVFCSENIQLVFTIFEKTKYTAIKVAILVHMPDLLSRFPNIIEPWTPRIYEKLQDPSAEIRKATFYILSTLILRDMIRAHSYLSQMANCFADEDPEINRMCRTFFLTLSHKENNLYNVLPDIFSHLMDSKEISEENIRNIMKFLFGLMDKTKHIENLVDRFCAKFIITEDQRHHRNIAYCLSLIPYNEKALKKLQENFSMYKHFLHDPDIYANFKTILQSCGKQQVGKADLKPIVAEIEKSIKSVFELNNDGQVMGPPPPPKSAKKPRGRLPSKKKQTRKQSNDSDSEEEFETSSAATPVRKSNRSRKQARPAEDDDSD